MDCYEINEDTLAILPDGHYTSKVIEQDTTYLIPRNPYRIMDDSCQYFGSSFDGREKGSKSILGSSYKVPIIVEEIRGLIFFPTVSRTKEECCWIGLNHVKSYEKSGTNTKIIFHNNNSIVVPVSYQSFQNQLFRATRLESVIKKRVNK